MEHIEEHILELYVLDSTKVAGRREEIASHLHHCVGCSQLADEIADFYREAKQEVEAIRATGVSNETSLVTAKSAVPLFEKRRSIPRRFVHTTQIGRLRYFVFQHPIVSGGGAFVFGALAFALFSLFTNTGIKDTSPSYVFPNAEQSVLEIHNKVHKKLWILPVQGGKEQFEGEIHHRITRTIVTDIDGDGKNEVVTTLPIGNEPENMYLRVFDAQQEIRLKEEFNYNFLYRDRHYTPRFDPTGLLALPMGNSKLVSLFVAALHVGRSPFVLSRRDASGNEIGLYWHYGNLYTMDAVQLGDSSRNMIVLGGENNTADTMEVDYPVQFPVIVVIDPEKVLGTKKSVSATGFDFPESDAEVYYIRLPLSDMDYARKVEAKVISIHMQQQNTIPVSVESGRLEEPKTCFVYIFDRNMAIREVKSTNVTETVHARLVEQGRITSKLDKAYLENLKEGVRYWDGREWRKEPVKNNHSLSLSLKK